MIITLDYLINMFAIVSVLAVLAAIALFLYHILKKEHEFQEKERKTINDYESVLKKAHNEAEQILDAATQTAQQILTETQTTNERINEDLNHVLQQLAQKSLQTVNQETYVLGQNYQQKLSTVEASLENNAQQLIQTTQEDILKQLTQYHETFVKKATATETMLDKKTQELLTQVDTEVAAYKKAEYEKLDQQIMGLMQKTYQEVLHRTMPDEIQHELIIEALEQARREGVFQQ
jgi:hypothetical protein